MNVVFNATIVQNQVSFSGEGLNETHIDKMIDGMFAALSFQSSKKEIPKEQQDEAVKTILTQEKIKDVEKLKTVNSDGVDKNKHTPQQEIQSQSRPRQLPLTGNERTLKTPIGELVNGNVPEHWITGIITGEDGESRYKTRYICPVCGDKGKRYVKMGQTEAACHKCQAVLKVKPATTNGFGTTEEHRDEYGNYMFANELAEPVESYTS